MIVAPGTTSLSIDVQIVDDTGLPVTGLLAAGFPAVSWSIAGNTAATAITLSDLAAITSAYSSGGVKERSGGYYRLDLPNAALASTGTVKLIGEATGKHLIAEPIVVGGLNSVPTVGQQIPNANAGSNGGLPTVDASNSVAIQAASIETVLRSIYGYKNVYHVQTTGNDGNAGTTAAPVLTVAHAATLAGAGDAIAVGAGTFTETSTVLLAAGVTLMGVGPDATTIVNATSGSGVTIVGVSSNCTISDLTVSGTATPAAGVFQYPISDRGFSATDVQITRVRTKGDTDGLYFTNATSTVRATDCQLTSNWDCAYAQNGAKIGLWHCTLFTTAQNSAAPNSNSTIQCVEASQIDCHYCTILNVKGNTNASRQTRVVTSRNIGTGLAAIRLYYTSVYMNVDGSVQYEINVDTNCTVTTAACSYDKTKVNAVGTFTDQPIFANADTVWDAARSAHATAGSFGQGVASVQGNVTGSAASVTGAVGSVTAGVSLAAGEHTNIATDVQTGMTAQGYTTARGPKLDNLDAAVSSRLASASYTTPPTTGAIAAAVMGDVTDTVGADVVAIKAKTDLIATNAADSPNAVTAQGTIGTNLDAKVSTRLASGNVTVGGYATGQDPGTLVWGTALPGSFATGTAGKIVGGNLDTNVGSRSTFAGGAVASVTGAVGSVTSPVTVGTNNDKTGYTLAANGLDSISVADPGGVANMTTFPKLLVAVWRSIFKKSTLTGSALTYYADDGTTANATATVSDTGTVQTKNAAS